MKKKPRQQTWMRTRTQTRDIYMDTYMNKKGSRGYETHQQQLQQNQQQIFIENEGEFIFHTVVSSDDDCILFVFQSNRGE